MDWNVSYIQKGENNIPITLTCMWGGGDLNDLLKPPSNDKEEAPVIFMGNSCIKKSYLKLISHKLWRRWCQRKNQLC